MTPEQTSRFRELFKEMYSICGGLDPFSYARAREIYMAGEFGHTVADDYSGEDAIDENGKPVEYKSTIADKIQGTYNGISVHNTWGEHSYNISKTIKSVSMRNITSQDLEMEKLLKHMFFLEKMCYN